MNTENTDRITASSLEPMLYLCATPIGNLEDMTYRAVRVLSGVSAIYCEDTRRTRELLNHLEIKKPLIACHEHNEKQRGEEIAKRVLNGEAVAFVSDAGMPGISDPGEVLVSACIASNAPYTVLPGASAPLTALVMSGLPTKNACFVGFLPRENKPRREAVAAVGAHEGTLIFYESPLRISATAKELALYMGNRPCALVRELTKKFEQVVRSDLETLALTYAENSPRGECVLVVGGAQSLGEGGANAENMARELIASGVSVKDSAKQISALCDMPRNEAYALVCRIRDEQKEGDDE